MDTSSGWVWDAVRGMYYRYVREENCLLFQDGTRIPLDAGRERIRSDSGVSNSSINAQDELIHSMSRVHLGSGPATRTFNPYATGLHSGSSRQTGAQTNQFNITRDESGNTTTDPQLLSKKVRAYVRVGATPGEKEQLDKRYQLQSHPKKFFIRGRVFRILWPEPAGQSDQVSVYSQGAFNEDYHMKVRWFVVIREGSSFSSCLPINTYNGKGVEKRICVKDEHSIIYTGSKPPKPKPGEEPRRGEYGMHPSIQVKAKKLTAALDSMSRVNYAKVYTVEHNVKVFEFGDVTKKSHKQLVRNFKAVWKIDEEQVDDDIPEEDEEEDEDEGEYSVRYVRGGGDDDDEEDEEGDDDDDNAGEGSADPESRPQHNESFNILIATLVSSYRANGFDDLADWLHTAPRAAQMEHIEQARRQQQQQQQRQQASQGHPEKRRRT